MVPIKGKLREAFFLNTSSRSISEGFIKNHTHLVAQIKVWLHTILHWGPVEKSVLTTIQLR